MDFLRYPTIWLSIVIMLSVGCRFDRKMVFEKSELCVFILKSVFINFVIFNVFCFAWLKYFNFSNEIIMSFMLCGLCAGGANSLVFIQKRQIPIEFPVIGFIILNLLNFISLSVFLKLFADHQVNDHMGQLFTKLFYIIVIFQFIPFLMGVLIRDRFASFSLKFANILNSISFLMLITLFVIFAVGNGEIFLKFSWEIYFACLIFSLFAAITAYYSKQKNTVLAQSMSFVSVVRNIVLALIVNDIFFKSDLIKAVIICNTLFIFTACFVMLYAFKKHANNNRTIIIEPV
jgi:predicted Na+-dependent transporter